MMPTSPGWAWWHHVPAKAHPRRPRHPPPETRTPPSEQTALSIQLYGDQGSGSQPYTVLTYGPPNPPTGAIVVRDATGLEKGTVVVQRGTCRPAIRPISFAAGSTPWCLALRFVDAGAELTGTLRSATGGTLALTIRKRDDLWGWPMGVVIAGLLAGALAASVPRWLRERVRATVLERLVKNDGTDTRRTPVRGLEQWVAQRRASGVSVDELIDSAAWALSFGPAIAATARERLRTTLVTARSNGAGLPPALLASSEERAAEVGLVREDFLADDGGRLTRHPADLQADALDRATAISEELEGRAGQVTPLGESTTRKAALDQLDAVRARFDQVTEPDELAALDGPLDSLAGAVALAVSKDTEGRVAAATAANAAPRGALGIARVFVSPSPTTRTVVLQAATVGAALPGLVFAALTAIVVVYEPNPLFHSIADYWLLFAAAVGSGAGTTALAILGYWRVSGGTPTAAIRPYVPAETLAA
jgi:hypothetical protein